MPGLRDIAIGFQVQQFLGKRPGPNVTNSTLSHLLVNPTHHLPLIGPHVSLPHPGVFPLDLLPPVVVVGPFALLLGQRRVPPAGRVDLELPPGVAPGHHLAVTRRVLRLCARGKLAEPLAPQRFREGVAPRLRTVLADVAHFVRYQVLDVLLSPGWATPGAMTGFVR